MPWRMETLNETVAQEIEALPLDMQARLVRLGERITAVGLERLGQPEVKHLKDKLWEMRITGREGIARALYITIVGQRVMIVRFFINKDTEDAEG